MVLPILRRTPTFVEIKSLIDTAVSLSVFEMSPFNENKTLDALSSKPPMAPSKQSAIKLLDKSACRLEHF
ncbi:hypothetical protein RO3G_00229 [Rhizopus delemar RA 99-880]|uniref:Uncharacterized protein n=1 Tax=Rhizopus delemar (strain RA 99-880 / ATCC MYA-4621 / FGSC 9543 / NRRL 43880) TaxID=246409 RepID=I1BH45_RHIO9|nr:hypothetical protein RO3G_00229 [Rhizopus delemar RA 99-880]|eukprot:EIE75525.1 hypothetical protein RO3G_00229 [Rhizopus delemar RA 99-880]